MNVRPEPLNRESAIELLDQLIKWRGETDPAGHSASADQKNYKALQALFFGQQLFDNLLGWAIDHTVGVELSETDLQQRKKGDADVHHFEISGQEWIPNDPAEARWRSWCSLPASSCQSSRSPRWSYC